MTPFGASCCSESDVWRIVWRDYGAIVPEVQLLAAGDDGRFLALGSSPFGPDNTPAGFFPDGYDPTSQSVADLLRRWTLVADSNQFALQGVQPGNFVGLAGVPNPGLSGQAKELFFTVAAVADSGLLLARPDTSQGVGLPPGPRYGEANNISFAVTYIGGMIGEASSWINSQVATPATDALDAEWRRQAAAWKAASLLYFSAYTKTREDVLREKYQRAEKMAEGVRDLLLALDEAVDIALVAPMHHHSAAPFGVYPLAYTGQTGYRARISYGRLLDSEWGHPIGYFYP